MSNNDRAFRSLTRTLDQIEAEVDDMQEAGAHVLNLWTQRLQWLQELQALLQGQDPPQPVALGGDGVGSGGVELLFDDPNSEWNLFDPAAGSPLVVPAAGSPLHPGDNFDEPVAVNINLPDSFSLGFGGSVGGVGNGSDVSLLGLGGITSLSIGGPGSGHGGGTAPNQPIIIAVPQPVPQQPSGPIIVPVISTGGSGGNNGGGQPPAAPLGGGGGGGGPPPGVPPGPAIPFNVQQQTRVGMSAIGRRDPVRVAIPPEPQVGPIQSAYGRRYMRRTVTRGPRWYRNDDTGGHRRPGQPSNFYVRFQPPIAPDPLNPAVVGNCQPPLLWNRHNNVPGFSVVGSLGHGDPELDDKDRQRFQRVVMGVPPVTIPFVYMVVAEELVELHKVYGQFVFGDASTSHGSTVQFIYTKYSRPSQNSKWSHYFQRLRNMPLRGVAGTWLFKQAGTWQAIRTRPSLVNYIGAAWPRFRDAMLTSQNVGTSLARRQGLTGHQVAERVQVLRQYILACYYKQARLTLAEEQALNINLDTWNPEEDMYTHVYHKALQMQCNPQRNTVWATDMQRLREYIFSEVTDPGMCQRQVYWVALETAEAAVVPGGDPILAAHQQWFAQQMPRVIVNPVGTTVQAVIQAVCGNNNNNGVVPPPVIVAGPTDVTPVAPVPSAPDDPVVGPFLDSDYFNDDGGNDDEEVFHFDDSAPTPPPLEGPGGVGITAGAEIHQGPSHDWDNDEPHFPGSPIVNSNVVPSQPPVSPLSRPPPLDPNAVGNLTHNLHVGDPNDPQVAHLYD